jgi:protein-tyrosine phosphatase
MLKWVVEGILAGSHRPGYGGESGTHVPAAAVDDWITDLRNLGIRSIICLLHDDQLSLYSSLPAGLLEYYSHNGLVVKHVPAYDHLSPPLTEEQLEQIWTSFTELEKPVVVHCSAGIDRTGMATRYIQSRLP